MVIFMAFFLKDISLFDILNFEWSYIHFYHRIHLLHMHTVLYIDVDLEDSCVYNLYQNDLNMSWNFIIMYN